MSQQQPTRATRGGGQQPTAGAQIGGQRQPPGDTQVGGGGRQPAGGGAERPVGVRFHTQNYLPEGVRNQMIDLLNQVLADTTDLLTQVKSAHWNVKGMHFYGLHQLFEELAEVLDAHADDIAERATALGGEARGTVRTAAAESRLPELPPDAVSGHEIVAALVDRLAIHDADLGEAIQRASDADDLDTADLLNEVSRQVSKYLWFLESHLQGGQGAGTPAAAPGGMR